MVITIGEAGGSGKDCGGITVGVFGSTKTRFFGSSTTGGTGTTGGVITVGRGEAEGEDVGFGATEGSADFVGVGSGATVGVGLLVGFCVGVEGLVDVGEGDGLDSIA